MTILFHGRKVLADAFEKWAEENRVDKCPVSVVTWLSMNELINESRATEIINRIEKEPCDGYVSKKAVLKAIEEWWHTKMNANGNPSLCDDILALTPLTPQQQWIPCSEKLPEYNVTVIASVQGDIYPETRYSKSYGWEFTYEAGTDYWEEIDGVDAWMPLPKPYEKRGGEDD